eukprot:7376837-Alexandrium_andersonii.AAC.1
MPGSVQRLRMRVGTLEGARLVVLSKEIQRQGVAHLFVQRPGSRKATIRAPGVQSLLSSASGRPYAEHGEVGHCLMSQRWSSTIRNARSNAKAGLNTDHIPVEIDLSITLAREEAIEADRLALRGCDKEAEDKFTRTVDSNIAE